jgi:hypothetical protein
MYTYTRTYLPTYVRTYICMCVCKNLSFHVCIMYVRVYICVCVCVCVYLQETSVKMLSLFLCGNFSDIILTCVFYIHASRIWHRHEWLWKGCLRLCINSLLLSSTVKKNSVFIYSVNARVYLNKHKHIHTLLSKGL